MSELIVCIGSSASLCRASEYGDATDDSAHGFNDSWVSGTI